MKRGPYASKCAGYEMSASGSLIRGPHDIPTAPPIDYWRTCLYYGPNGTLYGWHVGRQAWISIVGSVPGWTPVIVAPEGAMLGESGEIMLGEGGEMMMAESGLAPNLVIHVMTGESGEHMLGENGETMTGE